ncbi:tapemeasure protein [Corynebacterium phage PotatoChip]|uniref:Tapemeasure protein n=1 Tax=Corynebacterium phage PotatoChip TaxID=2047870 RepID=A0A2H4P971_9CAUD|nr:tapemeasure protein [Corynebacterium phage PotatoChip]
MAAVGGVVHLTILPNAKNFHKELKRQIEDEKTTYSVTIDPDLDKFHMELDKAEDRIDRLDGRIVDLFLRVNDDQAARAVDDFVRDAEAETIDKQLTVDTSEARDVLDRFREEQRYEGIKTFVAVDRFHADEEMEDFRQKHADKLVMQKVVLDFESPTGVGRGGDFGLGGGSQKASKKLMGVRGAVDFDSAPLDAVNALPRMFKNMNAQLDLGIRQVYDSYFNLFSKMYKFTSKPFFDFTNMAREAKTLGEFLTGAAKTVRTMNDGLKKVFTAVPRGFRMIRDAGDTALRGIKQIPDLLREISTIAQSPFRLAARSVRKLFDLFSPAAVSALGKVRGGFVRIGQSLSDGFVMSVNGARMQLRRLAEGFASSMSLMTSGPIMNKVTSSIRRFGGAGAGALSRMMSGFDLNQILAQANGITKGLAGRLSGAGVLLRKALGSPISGLVEATRDGFSAIGDYWGAASRKIGDATLGLRMGITRTFRGMTRTVGDLFSKMSSGIRNTFASIGNFIAPLTSRISKGFSSIVGVLGKALSPGNLKEVFTGLQIGLTRSFRGAFPAITRAFGVLTGALRKGMGAVLNNEALYKGLQVITRRISTAAMGFSRIMMGTFAKVSGVLMKSLIPALGAVLAGVLALGGQAAIGAVLALAGALQSVLMGAIVMMPAALGAVAVGFGVLKMGLEGVKTSMSAALSADSVEEFEQAIADAHPAVQNLARAMREFKGPIDDMKSAVQGNMLEGLDVGLRSSMSNLLPIFSEGAQKIATSWNRSLGGVLDELSSDRAASGMTALMAGVEEMSIAMEPTLANLVAAAGSLTEQGAKFLGPLGGWINGLSESIFNWAESLRVIDPETGMSKFDAIMESAKTNAEYLGKIFGGLFGTLSNVLQAAAEGGSGLLGGMAEGLGELNKATEKGTEGYAAIVGFMEGAARAASSLKFIMEPLLMSVVSVGQILADVAYGAMPGLAAGLTGLQIGLEGLTPFAEAFGASMGGVLEALAPLLAALGTALGPALAGLAEGLNKMFEPLKVGGPFDGFYKALADFGPIIGNSLTVVGEALGKIVGASAPMLDSFMGLLNALMPIFDLFSYWVGEIIAAVLQALEPFMLMRDQAVAGLLEAIKPLINVLGEGLMGVINALAPMMPMLAGLFVRIVEAITPIIPIVTKIAGEIFVALIDIINALMPVVAALIDLIGRMIDQYANMLIPILEWVLETFQKVWPIIVEIIKWAIDGVILPLISLFSSVFEGLAKFIGWAIENVIVPVLTFLGDMFAKVFDGIIWVIDNLVKPALNGLKDAFSLAVDGITWVWEGLKKIFAQPIRFFLETVVNDGIIRGWNWIGPKIGLDKLDPVNVGDLGNYASGGVLPGYSPGYDNYEFVDPKSGTRLGLSGGEAIMRPEWTKAVGGPKAVAEMNRAARAGKPLAYRDGGVYPMPPMKGSETGLKTNAIRAGRAISIKFPEVQTIGGYRPYDPYPDHPSGRALDVMVGSQALGDAIKDYLFANNSVFQMQYALWKQAQWNTADGAIPMADRGSPTQNHYDHVHAYFTDSPYPSAGFDYGPVPEGAGTAYFGAGDGGSWFNPALQAAKAILGKITSTIFDPLKGALNSKFGDNPFGLEAVGGLISKTVDAAVNKFTDTISSFFGGGGGGDGAPDLSSITGPIVSQVEQIFARHGFTGDQWEAAKWIVQKESSWNPNAQNPGSTAYGLFQFLDSTWAETGIGKTSDPKLQGEAGARYIKSRYGDPVSAKNFWQANNWYDQGGIANGVGLMQKNVITPERVLSPSMTAAFDDFVYGFMPQLISEFKSRPFELRRHFETLTAEIARIHKELRDGNIARLTATMKDEFKRRASGENLANNPIDFNFDSGWAGRNGQKVMDNLTVASRRMADAVVDPDAYLEAEAAARKQLEEEFEAEKEKAKKEADEAKSEADKAEEEARREKEQAEDEAAKTDEEREALKKQREEEAAARKEVADSESEAAQARQKEEDAKIEAAKADGSFYYGYKTFDAEGGNPNASEVSGEETAFRSFLDSFGDRTGIAPAISGVAKRFDVLRSIGEAAQTAAPAWMAALNGDPSGLAYNVAVGTAQVRKQAITEAEGLAPQALAGIVEMAVSRGNANNAPFIGEVNSGMTQAELMQTLEYYEGMRARRGTGTTRVR